MTRKNRQFLNNRLAACTSWIECQANTVLGQTIADGKKNGYGTYRLILECRNSRPAVLYKNKKTKILVQSRGAPGKSDPYPFWPADYCDAGFWPAGGRDRRPRRWDKASFSAGIPSDDMR